MNKFSVMRFCFKNRADNFIDYTGRADLIKQGCKKRFRDSGQFKSESNCNKQYGKVA